MAVVLNADDCKALRVLLDVVAEDRGGWLKVLERAGDPRHVVSTAVVRLWAKVGPLGKEPA